MENPHQPQPAVPTDITWINLSEIQEDNPIHFRRKPFNPQMQRKDEELLRTYPKIRLGG